MEKKPPLVLVLLGFFTMIAVPLAFFIFGWRTLDISCQRINATANCQVQEHFAAGLYTRYSDTNGVTDIGYKSGTVRHTGTGNHNMNTVPVSTVAFETAEGLVPISKISSNVDDAAKKQLINAFRQWFASATPDFSHHASFVSLFGWLGAAGTAFWVYVVITLPYYWLKKKFSPGST